jgi:hypothetical protein
MALQPGLEMIRKANGKGHDRERGIHETRRRKDGASRHIQIVSAVYSTLGVRDSATRVAADACRTSVVMRIGVRERVTRDVHAAKTNGI